MLGETAEHLKSSRQNYPDDYKSFDKLITPLVVNEAGEEVSGVDALSIDLALQKRIQLKDPNYKLNYPLYVYKDDAGKRLIYSIGRNWTLGPIWGYLALDEDGNTVKQALFTIKVKRLD